MNLSKTLQKGIGSPGQFEMKIIIYIADTTTAKLILKSFNNLQVVHCIKPNETPVIRCFEHYIERGYIYAHNLRVTPM